MVGGTGERTVVAIERSPIGGRLDNMTTAAIERVLTVYDDGTVATSIAKTLRPASDSPQWAFIPEEHHPTILATLDWLDEPRIYRSGLAGALPEGLRMPRVHRIDDGDQRVTIWMEEVADTSAWDLERYARTAHLLGRLAGRWRPRDAAERFGLKPRDIGTMFYGKVLNADLPPQREQGFWRQPHIVGAVGRDIDTLRDDLIRAAEAMPRLLDRLDEVDHGVCHGDASTTNFLEPGDGTIVAIDWSYASVGAIGSDLGQLVASRFDSGEASAEDLAAIAAWCIEAFVDGAASEGRPLVVAEVELAMATHLAIRSVFGALPESPEDPVSVAARAALVRFGLDLVRRCADT